MSRITIHTNGLIALDGKAPTHGVRQVAQGTLVWQREDALMGQAYREIQMPQSRYALSHAEQREQFERDFLTAIGA